MSKFRQMVQKDLKNIFLNPQEFAELHNLNGSECMASVQALTNKDMLVSSTTGLDGITGQTVNVYCALVDLEERPTHGQLFTLDDETYYVVNVEDNMGMLKIMLGENQP